MCRAGYQYRQLYSGGRFQEGQNNIIPPSNRLLKKGWDWIFNGIAACNEIIYETEISEVDFEGKDKILAEMKTLRAFFYYEAMANWGNIPFTINYTDTGYPEQKDRRFVFDFLTKELSPELISNSTARSSRGASSVSARGTGRPRSSRR